MFRQLNRAQARDEGRRQLGIVPPIDSGGTSGALPTRFLKPTNAEMNTAWDKAIAYFSRKLRLSPNPGPLPVPVAAQTADGPYTVRLQTIAPFGSVNQIRSVRWQATGADAIDLTVTSEADLIRQRHVSENSTPGAPTSWWVDSGTLFVEPAPDADGELLVNAETAIWSQSATVDGEIPEVFPADHFPILIAKMCEILCLHFPNDAEMQKRLPAFIAEAQDGLGDMRLHFARESMTAAGQMNADIGRTAYGGYR